jgi:hypothetical protein
MRARVYIHGRMLAGPHKGKMLGQYFDVSGHIDFQEAQAHAVARSLCRDVDGVVRVHRAEDLAELAAYRWDKRRKEAVVVERVEAK